MMRLVALILAIFTSTAAMASEFCDGFQAGYRTGYKQASGSSLNPLEPLCPLQPLKKLNDPPSDFEQGYLIGLQKGLSEGHR